MHIFMLTSSSAGYERLRGSTEGDKRSDEYNKRLRPSVMKHAMLEQLRSPPTMFVKVVKEHFRLCAQQVVDVSGNDAPARLRCSNWPTG